MRCDRDPWGRLLASPATLPRAERVRELSKVAARLQGDDDLVLRWLGGNLRRWLEGGGDLADLLNIRPAPGSRATPSAILARAARDEALLRLAVAAGSDALALAWLRGEASPPARHAAAVDTARELNAATGPHAIGRARRRLIASSGSS